MGTAKFAGSSKAARGGWHLTWPALKYGGHTQVPRTLPEVFRLAYVMNSATKPLAYFSTTGPRG